MQPRIQTLFGCEGAVKAVGLTVIIDVLRAFSTTCYLAAGGARPIFTAATIAAALKLKAKNPRAVMIGERHGRRLKGFDLGNSPTHVTAVDLEACAVIHVTTNGTRGIAAAGRADEIVTGSFVNAGALLAYIRRCAPPEVSLVCMGDAGRPALEDNLCADYLYGALSGREMEFEPMRRRILASPVARNFGGPAAADMPLSDLDLCLSLDRFDFVLRAGRGGTDWAVLTRIDTQRWG